VDYRSGKIMNVPTEHDTLEIVSTEDLESELNLVREAVADSGSQGGAQPGFVTRCAIALGWVEPSCREGSSSSRRFSRSRVSISASSTISAS